jgi:hypothetical protein
MTVYNTNALPLQAEELAFPYFFILDNDLRVSNVFFPNKDVMIITNNYFNSIKKRYFSSD